MLAFPLIILVGTLNGGVVTFEDTVGEPDGGESVETGILVVLLSDTTGIDNECEVEMLTDTDGNPEDTGGVDVTLALTLGEPDGVVVWNPVRSETLGRVKGGIVGFELLDGIVGSLDGADVPDPEDMPEAVLFNEIVGNPEVGDPPDKVLLDEPEGSPDELEVVNPAEELMLADIVGSPDEAGDPLEELFNEMVGNPEVAVELRYPVRPVTVGELKGGIEPEELFVDMVGTPVDELLEDMKDDTEAVVDVVGIEDGPEVLVNPAREELLVESVGNLDGAEDALLF